MDDSIDDSIDETFGEGFGEDFESMATTIGAYVSNGVITTSSSTTLRGAAAQLDEAGVSCIVIGTTTDVQGVVSERDIVRAVASGVDLDDTTVAGNTTRALKWATLESTVADVAEEMMENYVRHVLVGDDGVLVGIVSMRDLLGAYLD